MNTADNDELRRSLHHIERTLDAILKALQPIVHPNVAYAQISTYCPHHNIYVDGTDWRCSDCGASVMQP